MVSPRALIVFNPYAGRHPARRRRQLRVLVRSLGGHGWRLEVSEAQPTADVASGFDALLGCGGDGTLHALAQIAAGTSCRLGVAPPFGTANVLAHALQCPARAERAADWLTQAWARGGRELPVGVAERNGRREYFLAVASVGYDAAIVAGMDEQAKRRWGKLAFVGSAATGWRKYFPAPLTIGEPEQRPYSADGLFYSLTRFYAGRLRLGRPDADKPLLLALTGAPRLLPLQALALCSIGLEHAPGITRLPGTMIDVETPGRPLQLDGEAAGVTPVRLSYIPRGIRFLVP